MELGWCDVCLRVGSAKASRDFYTGLGFWRVEGSDDAGWAVVTNGEVRLGLYESKHMGEDPMSLNFRGGNIAGIAANLQAKGYRFEKAPSNGSNGAGSASLRDPDGHAIFFDTAPGEVKLTESAAEG
jgi:catechol 2,3-dioxygenase-like lactoylglutathione lyase family enzyme